MTAAPTFDLQSHSLHSDGELAPTDVVRLAAEAGVELLALTDHDTVDGVEEALAAGPEHRVRIVPAIELSAVHDAHQDLHILGYGIDHRDAALLAQLADFRADRALRIERMAQRLEELGFAVDPTLLERRKRAGKPLGRPHLALAVTSHADNADRLAREQLVDQWAFLTSYLLPGQAGYLGRTRPTVGEAIDFIHAHGGVAIWAHPFWDLDADPEVLDTIERFRALGLDGVEVFYITHTRDQALLLADHCAAGGLLMTGSADFHGPGHGRFSRFRAFDLHGRQPVLGPIGQS